MESLDLKKRYAALYKPSPKVPVVVDVPPLRFLMIDGTGPFGEASERFQESIQALYTMAYQTKFGAKKQLGLIYPVMPLEGLYRDASAGPLAPPTDAEASAWRLMILLPDEVPAEFVDEVREKAIAKMGLPRLADVFVRTFSEGASVQIMHVGPYSQEPPTVKRLLAFADERGYDVSGAHHEIYLGDPRRAKPEALKTVIRYGVTPHRGARRRG